MIPHRFDEDGECIFCGQVSMDAQHADSWVQTGTFGHDRYLKAEDGEARCEAREERIDAAALFAAQRAATACREDGEWMEGSDLRTHAEEDIDTGSDAYGRSIRTLVTDGDGDWIADARERFVREFAAQFTATRDEGA